MESGAVIFAIEMGVLAIVSALTYLVLRCMARFNPDGCLARPHGVRDVWIVFNGLLAGFVIVFIIFLLV